MQSPEQESKPGLTWISSHVAGHLPEDIPLEHELVRSVGCCWLGSGASPGDPENGPVYGKRHPDVDVAALSCGPGRAAPGIPQRYRTIVHTITGVR